MITYQKSFRVSTQFYFLVYKIKIEIKVITQKAPDHLFTNFFFTAMHQSFVYTSFEAISATTREDMLPADNLTSDNKSETMIPPASLVFYIVTSFWILPFFDPVHGPRSQRVLMGPRS